MHLGIKDGSIVQHEGSIANCDCCGPCPDGELIITVTGLQVGDLYMDKLGNGMHSMCRVAERKFDTIRHSAFNIGAGGITYSPTSGKASGRTDYSAVDGVRYSYTKKYVGKDNLGFDFTCRYKNLKLTLDYVKDHRDAYHYSGSFGTFQGDDHKHVEYTFDESYKNWKFWTGIQDFIARPWDMTEVNFNKLSWKWELEHLEKANSAGGVFPESHFTSNTAPCTNLDIDTRRYNTKHVTSAIGMVRGKKYEQTISPIAFAQDFSMICHTLTAIYSMLRFRQTDLAFLNRVTPTEAVVVVELTEGMVTETTDIQV